MDNENQGEMRNSPQNMEQEEKQLDHKENQI